MSSTHEVGNGKAEPDPHGEKKTGADPGWLPDDELTHDWLRFVEQFRSECDAADRRRLLHDPTTKETPS